jgi:hypothetical protein
MLAPESEFPDIIRPFSRIIISSFSNKQQSLERTGVIRTETAICHSFYHPIFGAQDGTSLVCRFAILVAGRPAGRPLRALAVHYVPLSDEISHPRPKTADSHSICNKHWQVVVLGKPKLPCRSIGQPAKLARHGTPDVSTVTCRS